MPLAFQQKSRISILNVELHWRSNSRENFLWLGGLEFGRLAGQLNRIFSHLFDKIRCIIWYFSNIYSKNEWFYLKVCRIRIKMNSNLLEIKLWASNLSVFKLFAAAATIERSYASILLSRPFWNGSAAKPIIWSGRNGRAGRAKLFGEGFGLGSAGETIL